MLMELRIKNLAIIEQLEVTFGTGLNVITGETGAGKSIIIGALALLLGERANTDLIRTGEETLTIEGVFDVATLPDTRQHLEEIGGESEGELVIRRLISRTGKNRVYIGGAIVPLGELTKFAENLVAICSQHEHQLLLHSDKHIDILDDFCLLRNERESYTELFTKATHLKKNHAKLIKDNEQARSREDFLRYQQEEIASAKLSPGEEEALTEERLVLANAQKLADYAHNALSLLYLDNGSVTEKMRKILTDIQVIAKIDSRLQVPSREFEGLCYQLEDAATALREYANTLVFSPERLAEVEERLELIKQLKRKHGGDVARIIAKHAEISAEIEQLLRLDEEIASVATEIEVLDNELLIRAQELRKKRQEGAKRLKEAIEGEISSLKLAGTTFEVAFSADSLNSKGYDGVEFYLSTNVGEEPRPLSQIASGGELSRIVLAIRSALAKADVVATIVFDEVDSGIGGAVASLVGEKIARMSSERQVICITHLPQIACFAQRHLFVAKGIVGEQTVTNITLLDEEHSVEEIARMLGGKEMTAITREHAREMLQRAKPQ
ncbi:MAG: DNA repair protein RecN [Deltaproteobacteria bacterium]|nr:DNA repair protein RecN [Deltaproteobacteria bacterium]